MEGPLKILVIGDVKGQFEKLVKKLFLLNKKSGPFECALCVGDFFGDDPLVNKQLPSINFPLSTYVLGPNNSDSCKYYASGSDLAPNLTYLGTKGVLTLACGITVAYLSGIESSSTSLFTFDPSVINELIQSASAAPGFDGVDILLTSQWPADVWKFDAGQLPFDKKAISGSTQIARLAAALRPRYHFAGMNDIYYARQPYRNHKVLAGASAQVTRFISLANLTSSSSDKANRPFYAFNMLPMKKLARSELIEQPPGTTEFPYAEVLEEYRRKISGAAGGAQYFYDTSHREDEEDEDRPRKRRRNEQRQPRSAPDPSGCWFCLSNADVEKHMVIAIGNFAYVALAKGGLTDDHSLILPIDHVQSISSASDELLEEVEKFKTALSKCADSRDKKMVFFERNFKTQHFQIQCIPVSKGIAGEALEKALDSVSELYNVTLTELPKDTTVSSVISEGNPYFWIQFDDRVMFSPVKDRNFPVQFGREVVAGRGVLDVPHKADWRACQATKDQEFDLAQKLRETFGPFDFTEDDD